MNAICLAVRSVQSGLLAAFLGIISSSSSSLAATSPEVASQPVGLIQLPINPGANFISAPLHRIHTFRGVVASATADSLTVTGNPAWSTGQFGPQDGHSQFIVIVRMSTLSSPSHEGDWWPVVGNSGNSLTVNNRSQDLSTLVQAGDHVEVRHLTTIKDLFGTGSSVLLNKDSNGFASTAEEDVIRFVSGTSFSTEVFYHDGSVAPEGYYADGVGPYDGSTLTLWPDQAMMFFRKSGSPSLNVRVLGQVQVTRLTHYLQPGANPIGTGFAASASIGSSALLEAGWVSDANGFGSTTEEDLVRTVVGTGFDKEVFHHNGALAAAGWYVNGALDDSFPFETGTGYFFFIKGPVPVVWRQAVP